MRKEKIGKNLEESETLSKATWTLPTILRPDKIENNGTYALQISRRFLIILGIWQWQKADESTLRFVFKNISVIVCYVGLGMCVLPTGLTIARAKDPVEKLKLTGPWLFCAMAAMNYFFLRSHRWDIENCVKKIDLDWSMVQSSQDKKIMFEHARYGHLVTMTCAVFSFSGGFFFAMLPLVVEIFKKDHTDYNNNNHSVVTRQLSLPSNFVFFDPTETPVYEIVYAVQIFFSFMIHSIAVTCYSLAVLIVMHVCGQLKILMENIDKLVDEKYENSTSDKISNKISDIVRHHVRILGLIASCEKMLREICLVDLGGGTLDLCFAGYLFLLEWESEVKDPVALITYCMLFGSFLFNIFAFCYIGELLTGECKKVGEKMYMIDWYLLPEKKSRDLHLIIAMAQKSVNLTAGGAIQFSYVCFTSVVKTSMGYLNVLRATMN